jgi:hypothetical protein
VRPTHAVNQLRFSEEGLSPNMGVTVVSLVLAVVAFLVAIFLMLPVRARSEETRGVKPFPQKLVTEAPSLQ